MCRAVPCDLGDIEMEMENRCTYICMPKRGGYICIMYIVIRISLSYFHDTRKLYVPHREMVIFGCFCWWWWWWCGGAAMEYIVEAIGGGFCCCRCCCCRCRCHCCWLLQTKQDILCNDGLWYLWCNFPQFCFLCSTQDFNPTCQHSLLSSFATCLSIPCAIVRYLHCVYR